MGQFSEMDEKALARKGQPIEYCGLTFYPIQMRHYELYLMCKDSLAVRLSTLPVKYASKDYINAIFSFEIQSEKEKRKSAGLFIRILTMLQLSLRIESFDKKTFFKKNIRFKTIPDNDFEIDKFILTQEDKTVEIPALEFSTKIRSLIAMQNGVELPDESINVELVKAQAETQELKNSKTQLKQDVDSLIASVAYNSKIREREINDWTVLEFENRRKAIDRDKKYMLYGQAEMGGMVSFKKGNPYPSWCYDSIDEEMGTMSISALATQNGTN